MKLLIDTCTLLWLAADQTKLTEKAIRLIRSNPDELFVSAATIVTPDPAITQYPNVMTEW